MERCLCFGTAGPRGPKKKFLYILLPRPPLHGSGPRARFAGRSQTAAPCPLGFPVGVVFACAQLHPPFGSVGTRARVLCPFVLGSGQPVKLAASFISHASIKMVWVSGNGTRGRVPMRGVLDDFGCRHTVKICFHAPGGVVRELAYCPFPFGSLLWCSGTRALFRRGYAIGVYAIAEVAYLFRYFGFF
jgi:hypothetical protein